MTETRSLWRAIISSLLIALLVLPSTVYAQDFEFGEEESEEGGDGMEFGEEGGEEAGEEGGGMEFDSDDLSKEDAVEEKLPQVALVAIPGPDKDRNRQVQEALNRFAKTVPDIIAVGPETVLPAIMQRDIETCVSDPICLGAAGDEGKVDRIVTARVKETPEGNHLDVDYFDVKDRLFLKYHSEKDVGGTGAIVEAIEPALKDVFSIREKGVDQDTVGNEDSGIVQDVVAWGSGGLAAVSLGLGIYFGLQATSKADEVEASKNPDGSYDLTQAQAESIFSDAESLATTANIFYGLAAALTVTSVVFFIIRGGSDVSSDQERTDLIQDLRFAPIITEDTAGFGAGFRF